MGDAANFFVLTNTGIFLASVVGHALGRLDFFSPSFMRDGFCVSWGETPLVQSHILCFYVDTVCAVALALLNRRYKDMPGREPVALAPAGILIHGLGHLATWFHRGAEVPQGNRWSRGFEWAEVAPQVLFIWTFFFLLLRSAPNTPSTHAALHAAVHAPILVILVPGVFGFTYVQTVLLWVSSCYDLLRVHKDRYYDLSAALINLPVGLVSWVEASQCDTFLKAVGGHVYYDAIIPVSMFVYYATVLATPPKAKAGKAA